MELASAYGREGRVQEALDRFARATAIMPEYAAAWYNRANLLAREGRFAEAEPDYERALQHAPRLVQAWYNLALVRQSLGKLPQAVAAMERAAQSAPADPQIRLALADLLLASGRLPEAISAYGAALAAGSDPVATRVNRGVALQRIHGCDAALPDYLAAVATAPTHPNARANAISCLRDLGRIAEAERLAAGRSLETKPAGR
jgi:tetratricopeptide (TPR) repeat protein